MARNQIKKEVKMKDSIQSTNSKLISNLKKKKKERSSHDVGIGGGRTLYFSHPVKFLAKSEDRFHGIVEYVDTDSCFWFYDELIYF